MSVRLKKSGKQKVKLRKKGVKKVAPAASKLIKPSPEEAKSGCLWCSLFPFTEDFPAFAKRYQRNAEKIRVKERDPHTIHSRAVSERPWRKVKALFVGEALGADEDREGVPFVGRSGKLLRMIIDAVTGLKPEEYALTNVVRCRPPRNRDPRAVPKQCCSYELVREIQARQPEIIVVLGNISLEYLTGQTGITTFAGHVLQCTRPEFPDLPILACVHPAYVLRMDHWFDRFSETLADVKEYLEGRLKPLPGAGEYHVLTKLPAVRKLFKRFKKAKKVAFDTECGSLTPFQDEFPRLLCFSFSDKAGVGYTVPFDHVDASWTKVERKELTKLLREFFTDESIPKLAQNEKFDRQHIRHALGVEPAGVLRDTMLTHLLLDERKGTHGLKTLAFMYTGMGGYERPLDKYIKSHKAANPAKGGSYANIPGELLFPYGAMDADVTYRVDDGLIAEKEYKESERFRFLAELFLPELSITLSELEYAGAQVNPVLVAKLDKEYREKMAECVRKIGKLPKVRQFTAAQIKAGKKGKRKGEVFTFNPGSTTQLGKVLFEYYGLKPIELTNGGLARLSARHKRLNAARKEGERERSFKEVVQLSIARKEWDVFTTKGDVLQDYDRMGNDLASLIVAYRGYQVIHSTFITPLYERPDAFGRVHGSYLLHGTVSGRLSSQDPNLQNIPDPAKPVYVSRFGDEGVILQADLSQIELRIAACWYDDPSMIAAYNAGVDIHMQTGADIKRMSLEDFSALPESEWKPMRTRAKRVNFGILYGGGPPALMRTLKKDGIFITEGEAQELIDNYFTARPGLRRGINRAQVQTQRDGFLESFTGRRRRLPEVFSENHEIVARALRQSVNFPIQSGASDIALMALVLVRRAMKADGLKSKIILTVHDSIVFDCRVDEVLELAALVKEIMECLPELSEEVLPGLDWSWLKVPIVADMEVGYSWGSMVGFDPETVLEGYEAEDPLFKKGKKGKEPQRQPVNVDELWDLMNWKAAKAA